MILYQKKQLVVVEKCGKIINSQILFYKQYLRKKNYILSNFLKQNCNTIVKY